MLFACVSRRRAISVRRICKRRAVLRAASPLVLLFTAAATLLESTGETSDCSHDDADDDIVFFSFVQSLFVSCSLAVSKQKTIGIRPCEKTTSDLDFKLGEESEEQTKKCATTTHTTAYSSTA